MKIERRKFIGAGFMLAASGAVACGAAQANECVVLRLDFAPGALK